MKLLNQKDFKEIIVGANFLGTGGGGTLSDAKPLIKKIKKQIKLISINELKDSDLICTVFGIGGKQTVDPVKAAKDALTTFAKTGYTVSVIVPVEMGAESIATALFIASELNIPLLDSDIVGLRSSPEIFLETISLANISRTPCAISDGKGNNALVTDCQSIEKLEELLRNFAVNVGGDAFVAGYPMTKKDIKNVLPFNGLTTAQIVGRTLMKHKIKKQPLPNLWKMLNVYFFDSGVIIKNLQKKSNGFELGEYIIRSQTTTWKIIYKNENLVLLKNNKIALTCPDSIILVDLDTFQGINNFETNEKKRVAILGKKAIPIWRTRKGRDLFSPKNLGFEYGQKLLK